MEKKINKLTDEELARVSGGGAIYNTDRGNIPNPDKIFGGNDDTKKTDGVNPLVTGNHEFNYCFAEKD